MKIYIKEFISSYCIMKFYWSEYPEKNANIIMSWSPRGDHDRRVAEINPVNLARINWREKNANKRHWFCEKEIYEMFSYDEYLVNSGYLYKTKDTTLGQLFGLVGWK